MARKGAMAKNPPLRGQARKNFRAAQREAVASGGPMPTQDKFRPKPSIADSMRSARPISQQPTQTPQPTGMQPGQSLEQIAGQVAGQIPPDKMYRFPQPGNQAGAAIGAAMEGAGMGNIAGSRSQGSPVFNAFPGNNPANLNQGNLGNPGDVMYPGASATFDETGRNRGFNFDQLGALIQKGQVQNGLGNFMQMPQPSANNGGKYRLSPGVYGTREQAMQQWAMQPAVPGAVNAPGSMSQIDLSQAVPYEQRRR